MSNESMANFFTDTPSDIAELLAENDSLKKALTKKGAELERLKDCLLKYAKSHESIELLARNIVEQCSTYDDLTQCTPIQLTKEHRDYINNVYVVYDFIESNPAQTLLEELSQEKKDG